MNIFDKKRIIVVGNNGSGKSYFSRELSTILELPLIHLDREFWLPNWEQPPRDEWIKRQVEFISEKEWIIDGNHNGATMELRFQSADLVIFLDINRLVCLIGVLTRHGNKRSDIPDYLEEKFDRDYVRFLTGLWQFPKKRKKVIMDLHNQYKDTSFLVIKSRRDIRRRLKKWSEVKLTNDLMVKKSN